MASQKHLNIENLKKQATTVRRVALEMIYHAGSGHPGGALSAAEVLTFLYLEELRLDPNDPYWAERDRFVLSKGHACAALYAVLGLRGCLGPNPTSIWRTFRKLNSMLQGHPDLKSLPWVEASSGSLGQGFSAATGMALGLRYQNNSARVYAMLGDGELQEGQVWEAAMFAAHHNLGNLCAIVDYNKIQSDAFNEEIIKLKPLATKWKAFNWNVIEIDGHDFEQIKKALNEVKRHKDSPSCIIAHTIKGKCVSYMENSPLWHGSVKLSKQDLEKAFEDLGIPPHEIRGVFDESAT